MLALGSLSPTCLTHRHTYTHLHVPKNGGDNEQKSNLLSNPTTFEPGIFTHPFSILSIIILKELVSNNIFLYQS